MSRGTAEKLTALEHLQELARRLVIAVLVMSVGAVVAYVFRLRVIQFLQHPLHEKLYYTSPMGSFQFVMQVCMLCGAVLALPIAVYNVLRFVEPIFTKGFSRKFVLLVLSTSMFLTASGVVFSYYLTLPLALKFFGAVGSNTLTPLISVNEYFSFVLGYLATFAVIFQLPLLLLFINFVTPFKPGGLTKWRRHLYVGSFGVSLVMPSSPDPLSQVSLAIPIIALYEISVALIWFVNRKRSKATARASGQTNGAPATMQLATKPNLASAEPFSIAKWQENMRRAEQREVRKISAEVARVTRPINPVRTNYQQPISRAAYAMQRPTRRVISDIF